jgi:hypothetical protein
LPDDLFDRADPILLSDPFSPAGLFSPARGQTVPQAWLRVEMAVFPAMRRFHPQFEDEMAHPRALAHQFVA